MRPLLLLASVLLILSGCVDRRTYADCYGLEGNNLTLCMAEVQRNNQAWRDFQHSIDKAADREAYQAPQADVSTCTINGNVVQCY